MVRNTAMYTATSNVTVSEAYKIIVVIGGKCIVNIVGNVRSTWTVRTN